MKTRFIFLVLLLWLTATRAQYPAALPSSGSLSMQQIYNWMLAAGELTASTPYSVSYLNSKSHLTDKTVPYSLSDWYSYAVAGFSCGGNLTVSHTAGSTAPVNKTVTYGTVTSSLSGASKCWITQNLGASNQAPSVNNSSEAAAGWYWQFNLTQGFTMADDGTTRTPSSWNASGDPGTGSWEAAKDPCTILLGTGWRIPTNTEWSNAITNGGWSGGLTPAFASVLKIHAAGYLLTNGPLSLRGSVGYYWSSYASGYGQTMMFNSSSGFMSGNFRSFGFSVRCLKD